MVLKSSPFGFSGLCLLLGIATFAIQQGCSVTGAATSWVWGGVWFLIAIILVVTAIWFWDTAATHHWIRKSIATVLAITVMGVFSYIPTAKQYRAEHELKRAYFHCALEPVPVVNFPIASAVPLIDPEFALGSMDRWLVRSAQGRPVGYEDGDTGRLIYECAIKNVNTVEMTDISLVGTLREFRSFGDMKSGIACGGTIKPLFTKSVVIPLGDLSPGEHAVFYFYNSAVSACAYLEISAARSGKSDLKLQMDTTTEAVIALGPRAVK